MRYYELTVTPKRGVPKIWTSYPNGTADPGAQNIIYDIIVAPFATPSGMQTITVEGINLADLTQANQYAGASLRLKAGMGGGLPLENPLQSGVIAEGAIYQSFGNWIGTDMTLDFVVIPGYFSSSNPGVFRLNWLRGTQLAGALTQCLQTAYGGTGMTVSVNIDANIVASSDIHHACTTLDSLAAFIAQATAKASNGPVQIVSQNGTILAFDRTYKPKTVNIEYTDFIGQPTWIGSETMQMKLVARGDIQVGDQVFLPQGYLTNAPGAITTTSSSYPSTLRYKSTFSQGFTALKIRQVGNLRSSDGSDWATIVNGVVNP